MNVSKRRKLLRNKKGFTLIELIVVIAVIAILASVLLPRFAGFTQKARESALTSDMRNYATGISALIAQGDEVNDSNINNMIGNLGGTITLAPVIASGATSSEPTDNPSHGDFRYSKLIGTTTCTGTYDYETGKITITAS